MADLKGKTVLIIGTGLLGSEFARACTGAGASVVVADSDTKKGEALARELSARFESVDVTSPSSMQGLAKRTGPIDGVINAAYPKTKAFGKPFAEGEVEDMLENLDMHIGACLSIAKYFPAQMKKGSSIVFLGSIYGVVAPRFDIYEGTSMTIPAEYAAIKGGVLALTRYFASLFGPSGIRVNTVSPGGVADNQPAKFVEAYAKHLKLGKGLLKPSDVSGAVVFLLSGAASQITGQNIIVDGGWTL